MKKVLFSALGILGVVGSSLAFKTLGNFLVYCKAPLGQTPAPGAQCTVTVTSATLNFNSMPKGVGECTAIPNQVTCPTVTIYEILNS